MTCSASVQHRCHAWSYQSRHASHSPWLQGVLLRLARCYGLKAGIQGSGSRAAVVVQLPQGGWGARGGPRGDAEAKVCTRSRVQGTGCCN